MKVGEYEGHKHLIWDEAGGQESVKIKTDGNPHGNLLMRNIIKLTKRQFKMKQVKQKFSSGVNNTASKSHRI